MRKFTIEPLHCKYIKGSFIQYYHNFSFPLKCFFVASKQKSHIHSITMIQISINLMLNAYMCIMRQNVNHPVYLLHFYTCLWNIIAYFGTFKCTFYAHILFSHHKRSCQLFISIKNACLPMKRSSSTVYSAHRHKLVS